MKILLILPGTYPYEIGGVSTWAHNLISNLKDFRFDVLSITDGVHLTPKFSIPSNVERIYLAGRKSNVSRNSRSREFMKDLREEFIPSLRLLLDYLLEMESCELAAEAVRRLQRLFVKHGLEQLFRHRETWSFFKGYFSGNGWLENMTIWELNHSIHLLADFLKPLETDLGRYDIVHSALAGFSGLIGIVQKLQYGASYILTEHAIYYRERIYDLAGCGNSYRRFWGMVFKRISELNYYWADKIITVSKFNMRWQKELGADERRIKIIPNGVDVNRFKPISETVDRWSVISVIRIDPLKDAINLIEAMNYVINEICEARCYIYGPITDHEYMDYCQKKINDLGLGDHVKFMGYISNPELAYNRGWVVVQPSISEGAPIAVIEAMACGKPVVATDVGGVSEILGDAGILVPPRNPKALARGIVKILSDEELAKKLGLKARMRALSRFPIQRVVREYMETYYELVRGHEVVEENEPRFRPKSFLKPHNGSDLSLDRS